MRFKAGQQNFKFGNNNTAFLQRNVAYKKNHVNGVGVSSSGTLSKYNYSLWFSNSNAGFDINKDFKTKSGLSGVVGLSAMDGLKTRSVYASAKYGKFVLSASTLVLRAVELKKNGDSSSIGFCRGRCFICTSAGVSVFIVACLIWAKVFICDEVKGCRAQKKWG
jgi:hypothetical protein